MATDRSTPPPVASFRHVALDVPEPIILSNGMKMWVAGNGEDEINKLCLYVNGGTFQESMPMQATACSMAVFNGNKNMDNAQIAEAIDYYGAWRALQTYDNCTAFSLSSLNENFDRTLPILFDSLRFPVFPNNELELAKRQLAVNCATARERVMYIASKEMLRLYYGTTHPLATDPAPDDIMAIGRDNVTAFHSSNYTAQNCSIVLAGRITSREIDIVDRVASQWLPTGAPTAIQEPEPKPGKEMLKIVHKDGAVQAAITMTIKAIPRRHPDYFPLRILTTVLGGYFGSRLMANIREDKGYTYGISASLSGRSWDGHVSISTECDTRHTWNVIDETRREIERLRQEPVPHDELDVVKRHMLSDMVKTLDTPFNIASYIGNMFCYGTYPTYFNEHIEAIDKCTSEQLLQVAQRYLNLDQLRIVIACDKNQLPQQEF